MQTVLGSFIHHVAVTGLCAQSSCRGHFVIRLLHSLLLIANENQNSTTQDMPVAKSGAVVTIKGTRRRRGLCTFSMWVSVRKGDLWAYKAEGLETKFNLSRSLVVNHPLHHPFGSGCEIFLMFPGEEYP